MFYGSVDYLIQALPEFVPLSHLSESVPVSNVPETAPVKEISQSISVSEIPEPATKSSTSLNIRTISSSPECLQSASAPGSSHKESAPTHEPDPESEPSPRTTKASAPHLTSKEEAEEEETALCKFSP